METAVLIDICHHEKREGRILVQMEFVVCRGGTVRYGLDGNKQFSLRAVSPCCGRGFGRDDRETTPPVKA